jgi:hypothetical protein
VFITSEGEAIVYQGNNPSSASFWQKIGTYFIGKPIGRRCVTQYGGDVVILTENGAFPLSAALQSAVIDSKLALSFKIEPTFTTAARSYSSVFGWCATVFPARNALIVNVPNVEDGTHYQYVMNTITKAWCRFTSWAAEDFAVFNGELYFAVGTAVQKAWTGTADDGSNIEAYGKSAFSPLGYPGAEKHVEMFQPILAVNGNLSFLTDIDVDFQDGEINGSATYNTTGSATWDVDQWDVGYWATDLQILKEWTSPDEWTGKWVSGKVKIATNALTIQWMATSYMFTIGGPM